MSGARSESVLEGLRFEIPTDFPSFVPGLGPYCLAMVTLDEQADVKITTQLVDVSNEEIEVGMSVQVVFVNGTDGVKLPFFRPVSA